MMDICYICGKKISGIKTREHVIPRAIWQDAIPMDFDQYQPSNVLPACRDCNNHKSSSILFLPITPESWWPVEYVEQLKDLQVVFEYLMQKIYKNQSKLKLRSGYFHQWISDYQLYRLRGVSNSEFNKKKIYVSTKWYMQNDICRKGWWL